MLERTVTEPSRTSGSPSRVLCTRRELIRTSSLIAVAGAAAGLVAGCGSGTRAPGRTSSTRLVSADLRQTPADPAALDSGARSVVALCAALYGGLADSSNGNLALSPYSAAAVLAMGATGAAGVTQAEMLDVLGAASTSELDARLNAMGQYVASLAGPVAGEKDAVIELASVNQVFGQHDERWQPSFLQALARSYGTGVREVDFENDPEAARTAINHWAADHTHDRIEQIVPQGALDTLTRLVLVDALFLKAPWQIPFDTTKTRGADFHLADGSTVSVPTMNGTDQTLGAGDGWRSARLRYSNDLAMTVVLPDEGRAADVDALVVDGRLAELLVADAGNADLALPRWAVTVATRLDPALKAAGMTTAFTDSADFSPMTTQDQLWVSAVLQQVYIAVDEAGTEAAAVTAEVFSATSAVIDPPQPLVVDRPFLFVIHDTTHGIALFLGRVADPRG